MAGQLRIDGDPLIADREREKKKKRAYLDDFEKDLNGNYQYPARITAMRASTLTPGCWLCCGCFAAAGLR